MNANRADSIRFKAVRPTIAIAAIGFAAALLTTASVMAEGARIDPSKIKTPPMNSAKAYITYMTEWRGDDRTLLVKRWGRFRAMVKNRDLRREKEKRAFLLAPREEFARTRNPARVYAHSWLGIGFGVTISGPHIVGRTTTEIDVKPGDKVLEIGTGSGYQTAVLATLCRRVYTVERSGDLLREAEARFKELGLHNVTSRRGDGSRGWAAQAPFRRIIVTAAAEAIPEELAAQLAEDGIMVLPLGPRRGQQVLMRVRRRGGALEFEELERVRFVPLVAGAGEVGQPGAA